MRVFLCYGYHPGTTGVYFERAFAKEHEVIYIGPPWGEKRGYPDNVDMAELVWKKRIPSPDLVLYIASGRAFFPRGFEKFPCPTACYLIDTYSDRDSQRHECFLPFFDHIFTAQKESVNCFNRHGVIDAAWLPLACDPEIHGGEPMPKIYDIGFVGHVWKGSMREKYLDLLAKHYKLNDYRKECPMERISWIYSQSKIVVNYSNLYPDQPSQNLNMRVFEAMASGAMLLTDPVDSYRDLFENGKHFVEYHDEHSLRVAVEYYLSHDDEREKIGQAGRMLVLERHKYADRCHAIIDAVFSKKLPRLKAGIRAMHFDRQREAYAEVYMSMRLVEPVLKELQSCLGHGFAWFTVIGKLIKVILLKLNAIFRFTPASRRFKRWTS